MHYATILVVLTAVLATVGCTAETDDTPTGRTEQAIVTGPAFYVDGTLYRTVGTPTELPLNAPAASFDVIYAMRGAQRYNVATVGPGQRGFNGGRWMVHGLSFGSYAEALAMHDMNASGDFDSNEEVEAALAAGDATDIGVLRVFECPVIALPPSEP
jgi:hypothetical protein